MYRQQYQILKFRDLTMLKLSWWRHNVFTYVVVSAQKIVVTKIFLCNKIAVKWHAKI